MSAEDYGDGLMKLAIARACVALGIKQCEKSVLNSLADIMRTYIETIGRYSQEQAEISHRACPGIQDVIPVLEYTKPKPVHWKKLRSFVFEDVQNPLLESTTKWHQPFPVEVPYYPIASTKDHSSSSQSVDPSLFIRDAFVPSHLPAYPPTHTYKKTKILPGDHTAKLDSKKRSHRDIQHNHDGNSAVLNTRGDGERRKLLKSSNIQSVQQSLALIEDSIDNTEQPQPDQI